MLFRTRHCFADSRQEGEVTSCSGWARVSWGFLVFASITTDPEGHGTLFSMTPHCTVSSCNLSLPDQIVQLAVVPLYHTGAGVEALQFQSPSGWWVYSQHSRSVNQRVLQVLIKSISLATKIIATAQRSHFTPACGAGLTDRTSVSSLANQSPIFIKASTDPFISQCSISFYSFWKDLLIFQSAYLWVAFLSEDVIFELQVEICSPRKPKAWKRAFKSRLGTREPLRGS